MVVLLRMTNQGGGRCSKVFIKNRHRPFVRTLQFFEKMKLPSCLCGLARGFHHELKCWSCGCIPWQHSSDDDHNRSLDSAEEEARRKYEDFQEQIRKISEENDRKMEEERERKYNRTLTIIEDGEIKEELKETREERHAVFQEQKRKLKKKKLKSKSKLNKNRKTLVIFRPVFYALNTYGYYKDKEAYEFDQVSTYMTSVFENSNWNTHRFLNADISLAELNIPSYSEYLKTYAQYIPSYTEYLEMQEE